MARVAVLIDLAPSDPEWKGAAAWAIINALAESQHDVQVFTPLAPTDLEATHARVAIARPAPSFNVATLLQWGRALVQYRPEVIHTFAPRPARFGKLTVWPYLEGLGPVLPGTRRVATLFDADDAAPDHAAARWLRTHRRWTAFHRGILPSGSFPGEIDLLEIADVITPVDAATITNPETLIPAPVSAWTGDAFTILDPYLRADANRRIRIVGGWGDASLAARRRAWAELADGSARVHLGEALSLTEFAREVGFGHAVWTGPLAPDSWRARVADSLRSGSRGSGDTINRLSRIYSAPGRW